jgi:TRAP-type C4-dicarboxylate transport system permease small subunit
MTDTVSTIDAGGKRLALVDRWLSPVEDAMNYTAGLAILALMFMGVAQIVLRKIFNAPLLGYIDLVELSMATFAFLGAAYCQRLGDHIRMEILLTYLKGRALWVAELVSTLLALGVVGILVWYGWDHFLRAYELGDTTIDAQYPVWPSKLLVPIAFAVWFLRLLVQLFGFLRLSVHPDAQPVAVPVIEDVAEQARDEIRETFGEDDKEESAGVPAGRDR